MNEEALLASRVVDQRLELSAAGSWTVARANELEQLVDGVAGAGAMATIDMSRVQDLDTLGAWLLQRLARVVGTPAGEARMTGIADRYHGLIAEI
jgi:phospholipid/cholesterol/gamma-HCH transport system permease protein